MTAEILCVGTELLMGQVLNTNAQYIARRLAALGVSIYHQHETGMRVEEFLEQITIAVDLSKRIVLIIESLEDRKSVV